MPIYEFFCDECNTIFKFFARRVNTEKIPDCPRCKNSSLRKQVTVFATKAKGREGLGGGDEADLPIDEARMEKAMAMLANEAGHMNENDPRQAANLMRKLSEATGLSLGGGMEEALRRMEGGEDPEKIEEEMGDLLEGDEPFNIEMRRRPGSRRPAPIVDETLYEM